ALPHREAGSFSSRAVGRVGEMEYLRGAVDRSRDRSSYYARPYGGRKPDMLRCIWIVLLLLVAGPSIALAQEPDKDAKPAATAKPADTKPAAVKPTAASKPGEATAADAKAGPELKPGGDAKPAADAKPVTDA